VLGDDERLLGKRTRPQQAHHSFYRITQAESLEPKIERGEFEALKGQCIVQYTHSQPRAPKQ
jgi:hypothetical protein